MNRRGFSTLMLAAALMAGLAPARAQSGDGGRTFKARLSVVPIDLAMARTVAGSGTVSATLDRRTLVLSGTFSGLKSPATKARLHRGPNRGLRGDAVFDLVVTNGTSGELSGTLELSAAQVEDLEKGRLYVQLHSEQAPEGNLWGWLLRK